jgi:hypothetical protein
MKILFYLKKIGMEPSNLPDINLNQSELTRDTYLVRVNPHKSSSNSRK